MNWSVSAGHSLFHFASGMGDGWRAGKEALVSKCGQRNSIDSMVMTGTVGMVNSTPLKGII